MWELKFGPAVYFRKNYKFLAKTENYRTESRGVKWKHWNVLQQTGSRLEYLKHIVYCAEHILADLSDLENVSDPYY